ncbi:hypothetical protein A606_02565 [Corynebacterium terpenotabidum Y-11]|uniref:Bacterial SCP orthologue domain-containing protein n=1 Tax=Corynebacterium terpenotabidum Y-11 TaxID=1200352 RepID=S4XC45_9CORY|nr:hypothetical protein A606_02565 [Corynebacterium terpenotabidum Y-11]
MKDTAQVRAALLAVRDWIAADEGEVPRPSRAAVAAACRTSLALLEADAPGHSVEVRVPPFAAVQCIAGPVHRRGTPPNVVQCGPHAWLRLATGFDSLEDAVAAGAEVSGAHAADVAHWLPVVDLTR